MAKRTDLTLYLGTDHEFIHTALNEAEDTAIDITGWSLSFMVKKSKGQADDQAVLTKTTSAGITLAGSYNADPDVNTQTATVAVADTDTDAITPGTYAWELKRTDAGQEAVLGFGVITLLRGVHRA